MIRTLAELNALTDERKVEAADAGLVDYAAIAAEQRRPRPKPNPSGPDQLTRDEMARMTPDQIVAADDLGRFAAIKAGR